MQNVVSIKKLSKIYDNDFQALKNITLDIKKNEIIALLGPNGAGKTTMISIICGIVIPTSGSVTVDNFDIIKDYRRTRSLIGLVPQELSLEQFEYVFNNVSYTRGLYGKAPNPSLIEKILKDLSLWDKRNSRINELSGGMKRRVLIAKALSHEPSVLFLDEPSAGVDVELRQEMWQVIKDLRNSGVTIILTTHYIEEAEAIADRVAVINKGELLVVDNTADLVKSMGQKTLVIELHEAIQALPAKLESYNLTVLNNGLSISYNYDSSSKQTGITSLLQDMKETGLKLKDLKTEQSSLENIFVELVREN
ncbi:ABC transporter ATP-binding protein [Pelagibacteraceae bacterium]|nr:ABC transporter ATP-binding protein [Pelagibacteraceae bacterium]